MKATWSMNKGLTIIGQPNQGQPRHWTVKAWASIASGEKIEVLVRPKGKVQLAQIIDLTNDALMEIEVERDQPTIDAGFVAVAR